MWERIRWFGRDGPPTRLIVIIWPVKKFKAEWSRYSESLMSQKIRTVQGIKRPLTRFLEGGQKEISVLFFFTRMKNANENANENANGNANGNANKYEWNRISTSEGECGSILRICIHSRYRNHSYPFVLIRVHSRNEKAPHFYEAF